MLLRNGGLFGRNELKELLLFSDYHLFFGIQRFDDLLIQT